MAGALAAAAAAQEGTAYRVVGRRELDGSLGPPRSARREGAVVRLDYAVVEIGLENSVVTQIRIPALD